MYDGGKIFIGLLIFLSLVTFPLYNNIGNIIGRAVEKPEPKLDTAEIFKIEKETGEKYCIESKAFMRKGHMKLLNEWRDLAVREGKREYPGIGGRVFEISLQNTCMKCHSNKKRFCDECHNYVAIKPYCWDCHIEPKEKET